MDFTPGAKTYQRATVTDGERLIIPSDMRNVFVAFQAITTDVFIRFGGASVAVVAAQVSTVNAEALTEHTSTPHLIVPAGQMRSVRLPYGLFTHFAHISANTNGFLIFGRYTGYGTSEDS
jgi:hypothetical protein